MFTRPSFIAGTVCLFLAAAAVVATAEAQQPADAAEVARLQAEIARLQVETARQQAEAEAQQRLQTELARLEAAVEIQQLQAEIARLRAEVARMQGPGVLTAPAQRLQGPGVLTAPAQQIATGELRRSMHRTWAGAGMIGAGVMVFGGGLEFCNRLDRRRDPYNRELYAGCGGTGGALVATGIGVATLGALLVTVWADIPAMRNLAVAPTVGGFQVGSSFEF